MASQVRQHDSGYFIAWATWEHEAGMELNAAQGEGTWVEGSREEEPLAKSFLSLKS